MNWRRRRGGAVVAAVVAAVVISVFASVAPAGAAIETVTTQGLTVTYTYRGPSSLPQSSHLKIVWSGRVVYDHAVTSTWCGTRCSPNEIVTTSKVIHIVRLQSGRPPSVVLDLYTGGAHCCSVEQVYSLAAGSTTAHKFEYDFGNPGARLEKIGPAGRFDFVSADNNFAYAFTNFAASAMPIQILSVSNESFHNVTRSFPGLVAKDAAQWMHAFTAQASGHYLDSVGVVAAWAADEDMLGHSGTVASFLAAQSTAGHLNSELNPTTLSGHRFVAALQLFLRKNGYRT